jgi:hypothetical protein
MSYGKYSAMTKALRMSPGSRSLSAHQLMLLLHPKAGSYSFEEVHEPKKSVAVLLRTGYFLNIILLVALLYFLLCTHWNIHYNVWLLRFAKIRSEIFVYHQGFHLESLFEEEQG